VINSHTQGMNLSSLVDVMHEDMQNVAHIQVSKLSSIVQDVMPVYAHFLPARSNTVAMAVAGKTAKPALAVSKSSKRSRSKGEVVAADKLKDATKLTEETSAALTPGQKAFRKLLASRRPGVMEVLQAMGAMAPTCVPSPLQDQKTFARVAKSLSQDPKNLTCIQFTLSEAAGVPGPGDKYKIVARSLRVCLFDVYQMKFMGTVRQVPLQSPEEKKADSGAWVPEKKGDATIICADMARYPQLNLYLELGQISHRKNSTGLGDRINISCGYALLSLKEVKAGSTGKRELAVSGGTPFMPRAIEKDATKSGGGFMDRFKTKKVALTIQLEKADKQVLEMVEKQHLPPNTVCSSVSALPIAHYHSIQKDAEVKVLRETVGEKASFSTQLMNELFTRGQIHSDPVLALFPKLAADATVMQHFNTAWANRFSKLSSKEKTKPEVLQKLVRECTLLIWPLLQLRAIREKPGEGVEASSKVYMDNALKAKNLSEMQKVLAGDTKSSGAQVFFQPFRIEELMDL